MFGWQGESPFQEDPMLLTPQQPPVASNMPLYDPPPGSIQPSNMPLLGPKPPAEVPRYGKPIGPENPTWGTSQPNGTMPYQDKSPPKSPQGRIGPWHTEIQSAGKRYGVDPNMLGGFMMIESGGNPNLRNKYGYSGLFQFQPGDYAKRGGQGSVFDPAGNIDVGARKFGEMQQRFQKQHGRAPTPGELYLMHQQGEGGAAAHFAAPERPAWQSMLSTGEGRQKGADWARRAIWDNVPNDVKARFGSVDNITSGDFVKLWSDKVGRFVGRFNGGETGPITAQGSQPTSTAAPGPAPQRGRGMLDGIMKAINSWGHPQAAPQPAAGADAIIANLDRMGIPPGDPMRGAFETYARALAGGPAPPEQWSPARKGIGTFLDVLGAGLGRRGGNTAAAPILQDVIAGEDKNRRAAEERAYQAQLQLLGTALPYVQGEAKRTRDQGLMQSILAPGSGGGITNSAPIAPGGAAGVQMPSSAPKVAGNPPPASGAAPAAPPGALPMGTAPVMPVQRAPLSDPMAGGMAPPSLQRNAGGPPAASQGAGIGTPPALPPSINPAQPAPQGNPAASSSTAPAGPAGQGSKFRITPEEVESRFPLPYSAAQIAAMGTINDKMADNMRQQNEAVVKQRDQFIKLYEVGRSTDDPQSAEEKAFASERGKARAGVETAKVDAARATQGITNSIKALDEMVTSDKFTEKAIGAWDSSPWMGGTAINRLITARNDVGSDEVRTFIEQRARGIAASMKPFVRKPGEGAWSDKDQEALENMVGDLTSSRDATDLRRRIRNIHSFIGDTFAKPLGVEMEPLGLPDVGGTSNPKAGQKPQAPRSAADEAPGATRTINGTTYVKTLQGWVPGNAATPAGQAPPNPATPMPSTPDEMGGQAAQQAAIQEQMRRLGISPMGAP